MGLYSQRHNPMCMYTAIITGLHAQALPSTIKNLQQFAPLLCDTTNPANLCFLHPPCPTEGGPTSWNLNICSRLLLAALILGFSSAQMPSAFCLSIPPSFLFSCLFLKIKIWWGICCSQQCRSPSDRNVQHETSHSKLSRLLQLWKRNRHQGSDESTYTVFSYNNGFIADQSVFPSALAKAHGRMTTTHSTQYAVSACSVTTDSAYLWWDSFLCDGRGNIQIFTDPIKGFNWQRKVTILQLEQEFYKTSLCK